MAKGLSDQQKIILTVISDLGEGIPEYYVRDQIKCKLFPELYQMRYRFEHKGAIPKQPVKYLAIAKLFGVSKSTAAKDSAKDKGFNLNNTIRCTKYIGDADKKNAARATVSRSISRLMKKGLIEKNGGCLQITCEGKQMVNGVD